MRGRSIDILCDTPDSFMHEYLGPFIAELGGNIRFFTDHKTLIEEQLPGADFLVLISCKTILPVEIFESYKYPIVVHPSKLPLGRGSAASTWDLLSGKNELWVTLFKPNEKLDRGDIYLQKHIELNGTELCDEWRKKQAELSFSMLKEIFSADMPNFIMTPQVGEGNFYQRRFSKDSELDINKTICDQFNLLRVCDNSRYPAFFYKDGTRYIVKIYKDEKHD